MAHKKNDLPEYTTPLLDKHEKHETLPGSRVWLAVVVMCTAVSLVCSIDRAAMSVTIIPMSIQYKWKDTAKGAVSGAFNLGYMVTNLYGGYLATRYSAKRVLVYGVVMWSFFTLVTPFAAMTGSIYVLMLARALMGLGEGVAFPCIQNLVKTMVPADKRSRALGLIYSGHQLGTMASLLISPGIVQWLGWPSVFYIFGSLGFVWIAMWEPLTMDAQSAETSKAAVDKVGPSWREFPWKQFLTNKAFLALVVAHSCFGVGYNIAMSWLPTYFHQEFSVDVRKSSWFSVLPWACMATTTNLSGWTADALINGHFTTTTTARKLLQTIGTLGPSFCLLMLSRANHLTSATAVALLSSTTATLGFQSGGFASNHQDISTRYAPLLYGITNACAGMAGSFSVYMTGVLLDAFKSWPLVFEIVALLYLCSCGIYIAFASSEQQFD